MEQILRAELEVILRANLDQASAQRLRTERMRAEMSDDDRWKKILEKAQDISPRLVETLEKQRNSLIERQEQGSTLFDEEDSERAVQAAVERVLPLLIVRRKELGITGPVTSEEVQLAEAAESRAGSAGHLEMMRQRIEAETDPQRKAYLRAALDAFEKGLGRLGEGDIDRITQRAADLAKSHLPPEN